MREKLRQHTIVGEQQKTLCVEIQSANRKDARFTGNQINNGLTSLRVTGTADDPLWFVQQVINEVRSSTHGCSINTDQID